MSRYHRCDPRSDQQCEECYADQVAWEREQEAEEPQFDVAFFVTVSASSEQHAHEIAQTIRDNITGTADCFCVGYEIREAPDA